MKRFVSIVAAILTVAFSISLAACSGNGLFGCSHRDNDENGRCDRCGEAYGECAHEDRDGDHICEKCGGICFTANNGDNGSGIETPMIPLDPD